MKNMGKEFCLNMLQFYENTSLVKDCYSIVLDQYDQEQAMVDNKLEEEKRLGGGKNAKGKNKDIAKQLAADAGSAAMNNSNKKKVKGKSLKKSVSTNDKKRSHSAEPKQLKPAKKKSAITSQNNAKPVKVKKKK
jgi:hypothetical protein